MSMIPSTKDRLLAGLDEETPEQQYDYLDVSTQNRLYDRFIENCFDNGDFGEAVYALMHFTNRRGDLGLHYSNMWDEFLLRELTVYREQIEAAYLAQNYDEAE